ncbi:hypothetical protein AAFP35_22430 [Gordonia sp. CPCC 206044]|uniref:hypothetical protein n=1 Tax=Gordonia sp. CPCC 206044 TaxID=3140793 RepID=UPI003AF3936B
MRFDVRRPTWFGLVAVLTGVVMVVSVAGCAQPSAADEPEQLSDLVARVVKASPDRDSATYRPPSRDIAQSIAAGVSELLKSGHAELGRYELETVSVSGQSRTDSPGRILALVERGDPTDGNGLYVARERPAAESPLIVQVPHPVADQKTELMGTQLFSETQARLFMMAGAHRRAGDDSADVAHRTDTTFAAVSDAVVQKGTTVVQLHGFSSRDHDDDYGDVVLSSSVPTPSRSVRRLAADLEDHGFDTCTYDGKKCRALGATTNVQAVAARARGADFIHIEVNQNIRKDRSERRDLMRVIADSLRDSGIG